MEMDEPSFYLFFFCSPLLHKIIKFLRRMGEGVTGLDENTDPELKPPSHQSAVDINWSGNTIFFSGRGGGKSLFANASLDSEIASTKAQPPSYVI